MGRGGGDIRGLDIAICLDVSRSMLARDVEPDRLARAKAQIKELTAARAATGSASSSSPARRARSCRSRRHGVVLGTPGPRRPDVRRPRRHRPRRRARDGARRVAGAAGRGPSRDDGEDLGGRGLAAAKLLKERGVAVHCVGLGTELGSKITTDGGFLRDRAGQEVVSAMDAKGLRAIAEATGGRSGARCLTSP